MERERIIPLWSLRLEVLNVSPNLLFGNSNMSAELVFLFGSHIPLGSWRAYWKRYLWQGVPCSQRQHWRDDRRQASGDPTNGQRYERYATNLRGGSSQVGKRDPQGFGPSQYRPVSRLRGDSCFPQHVRLSFLRRCFVFIDVRFGI